jgi:hypothetical protein
MSEAHKTVDELTGEDAMREAWANWNQINDRRAEIWSQYNLAGLSMLDNEFAGELDQLDMEQGRIENEIILALAPELDRRFGRKG